MEDPRNAAARWAADRPGQGPAYIKGVLAVAVLIGVIMGAATGFWAAVVLAPVAVAILLVLFLLVITI